MTSRRRFLGAAAALAGLPETVVSESDESPDPDDTPDEVPLDVFERETFGSMHVNDPLGSEDCTLRVTDYTHNDSPVLAEFCLYTQLGHATFALDRDEAQEMYDALDRVLENDAGGAQ